ncbi:MAG TPA: ceramidase domain-containing protein [Cytophagaceae bacterium]|jgi:hypothetical protein|nr:ceramidase domain-containing protein [Cytophagaceae bacterium]
MNQNNLSSELKSGRNKDNFVFTIKLTILLAVALGVISYVFSLNPVSQELEYHQFADRMAFFSIPNFWNVVSNMGFLVIGIWGIYRSIKMKPASYLTFFLSIGITLTFFGSSYYHWNPSNESLLWDRVPMTIIFMSFFTFIISDYISNRYQNTLLVLFLLIGIASVYYWEYTELHGHGDLRAYAIVQFLPMLLIPLILWLFHQTHLPSRNIIPIFLCYAIAKSCEYFDEEIFYLSVISGHTIKHLFASVSTYYMIKWTLHKKVRSSLPA